MRPQTATTAGAGRDADRRDRNLALELMRTSEYAALAFARWIGRGGASVSKPHRPAPARDESEK